MTKFIPFLSLAVLAAACNTNPSADSAMKSIKDSQQLEADTSGLAQFQQWKMQNELGATDQQTTEQVATSEAATPRKANTVHYATVQKRASSSTAPRKTTTSTRPNTTTTKSSTPSSSSSTEGSTASNEGAGTTAAGSGTGSTETTQKKEGMSKAAKGAIIGGVTGGVAGAVINKKNRTAGAVIGAVIGAGGGYILGKKADQKDGRNIMQ
jgi:hypothetical protein